MRAVLKASLASLALASALPALAQQAADREALGRQRAAACAVCHGVRGLAMMPDAPHLAGQPEIYLKSQIRAFRSGERKHEVMQVIAKPLKDEDIDALAAFYAAQKIQLLD